VEKEVIEKRKANKKELRSIGKYLKVLKGKQATTGKTKDSS
jgi:hypothetical protein